jgi:hypothetical protein
MNAVFNEYDIKKYYLQTKNFRRKLDNENVTKNIYELYK